MPKRPNAFMPMYWGDYHRDTGHLTTIEHGAYMLLIGHYWTRGEPIDCCDEQKRRVTRMTSTEWKKSRDTLANLFEVDGEIWRHKRIDAEIAEAERLRDARSRGSHITNGLRYGQRPLSDQTAGRSAGRSAELERVAVASLHARASPSPSPSDSPLPPAGGKAFDRELDLMFERWWLLMPKRGDHANPKKPARERWLRIVRADHAMVETLMAGARAYAGKVIKTGTEARAVAQGVTWLNQARWEQDAPAPAPEGSPEALAPGINIDVYQRAVAAWYATKHWPKFLGPAPGQPGCRVPPDMLKPPEPPDDS